MNTIYTLNINNYLPDLCKITIPTIRAYAEKIGFKFVIINERQYSEWPITYEKTQIYELGQYNIWNMFIDADTIIADNMPNLVEMLKIDHVGVHNAYDANKTLPLDHYFLQDGRNVGLSTNFLITHQSCHNLWKPFVESRESAIKRLDMVKASHHIIDELCISRNLAKYSYRFTGIIPLCYDRFIHLSATCQNNEIMERARRFIDVTNNQSK
jgi:hypothetical protein